MIIITMLLFLQLTDTIVHNHHYDRLTITDIIIVIITSVTIIILLSHRRMCNNLPFDACILYNHLYFLSFDALLIIVNSYNNYFHCDSSVWQYYWYYNHHDSSVFLKLFLRQSL